MPQIFASETKTFLIVDTLTDTNDETLGVVEFLNCRIFKFGDPDDEALSGHPLYNKGIKFYNGHIVKNSRWVEELKNINKVHPRYNEDVWKSKTHYILCFHDSTFECIAEDYKINTFNGSRNELITGLVSEV